MSTLGRTQCPICGPFVVPVCHDSQRPKLLFLGRDFLNRKPTSFVTDRTWREGIRVRLKARLSIGRSLDIQQKGALRELPAP